MPIVISRATGEIMAAQKIPQEQRDTLWGAIVKNYVKKHPEIFAEEEHHERTE